MGSLKRFDSLGAATRPFKSEGDLGVAASVPSRPTPFSMAIRQDDPATDLDNYSHLVRPL